MGTVTATVQLNPMSVLVVLSFDTPSFAQVMIDSARQSAEPLDDRAAVPSYSAMLIFSRLAGIICN
jgi:hypothetical protein